MSDPILSCIQCQSQFPLTELRYFCHCNGLLEVNHGDVSYAKPSQDMSVAWTAEAGKRSGVWRFREALLGKSFDGELVSHPEGHTPLYQSSKFAAFSGAQQLWLKHEGENPTGSFKDRGMTVAVTMAKKLGAKMLACASTGNTSASLAAYAAQAGIPAAVLLPQGKVATGKLAQALAYGAKCIAVEGDFDAAMKAVRTLADRGSVYMVNSLNPFRLEGQKTIMFETFSQLNWQAPDWIVVPGGNLGNTSAFGKAIREAKAWGWIEKAPRIAVIQAAGANPFDRAYKSDFREYAAVKADTVATAIRIGDPVNYLKAKSVVAEFDGVVESVTDEEILSAKDCIDRTGVGCEPASAASLAGVKRLVDAGIIKPKERVVGILTGHVLKDSDIVAQRHGKEIIEIPASMDAIEEALTRC